MILLWNSSRATRQTHFGKLVALPGLFHIEAMMQEAAPFPWPLLLGGYSADFRSGMGRIPISEHT